MYNTIYVYSKIRKKLSLAILECGYTNTLFIFENTTIIIVEFYSIFVNIYTTDYYSFLGRSFDSSYYHTTA